MTPAPFPPIRLFIVRRNGRLLVQTACKSAGELHDVLAAHGATAFEWATALWNRSALFHVSHAGLTVTESGGGQ